MLWSRKIMHVDYVTLSHPDRDHFGGLIFIARNFSPAEFWTSGSGSADESYAVLLDAMARAGAHQRTCDSASAPLVIGGVSLRCVGPLAATTERKQNNSSMVLRMSYGPASILFSGDIEARGERELIASAAALHSTILKVPHHGSRTSSTAEFIAAVRPAAAVVSVGYLNRFHFPAPEVIDRYTAAGVTVLRTDQDGAVSAAADGASLSLRSFRRGPVILDPNNR
jgi:competence protein ComEC